MFVLEKVWALQEGDSQATVSAAAVMVPPDGRRVYRMAVFAIPPDLNGEAMLPPPSDPQPPGSPIHRPSEASGLERFALDIPRERLTAQATQFLHGQWLQAPAMSPYVRLNYDANVRVRWNMHTNALEGSRVSHRDTAKIVINRESVAGYSLQEVNEVAGHDRALQRVERHARTGNRLRPEDLKEWQSLLLGPEPEPLRDQRGTLYPIAVGEWKSGANVIGLGGGRSRRTAAPDAVPRLMDDFLHCLHVDMNHVLASRKDLLDVLADTHSRFIEIHPFDDGNGRTGRLVMSWQCLRVGVPVIIIPVKHGDFVPGGAEHGRRDRKHAFLAYAPSGLPGP